MTERFNNKYCDRATGRLLTERVYADSFLYWSYNTRSGRWATRLFFKLKPFSRLYGWLHKQRWSRRKIRSFVERMRVDTSELTCSLEDFASFNDFFTREISLSKRRVALEPGTCIAPTDGKVLAYPEVEPDRTFRIKRSEFNLRELLMSESLAERYGGGSMVISRLCLADYHHFHFPDSGTPGKASVIPGKYYAGGPYSLFRLVPFYKENHRMLTLLHSDNFGRIAIVEIGAFTVGSIRQRYCPGARVLKGDHKGFFELGGSTVTLLFEKGAIKLDRDLCANTRNDIETYVRFGESIGRRK